jgi:hypothetical protein
VTSFGTQEIRNRERKRLIDKYELPPGIVPDFEMVIIDGTYTTVYAIHAITSDALAMRCGRYNIEESTSIHDR